ncbi:hypothetical protein HYFRA_00009110 [Hymenoscyphus fraxineus]|uniref:Uncharacterized protein n=1 Tax=Hymenoscyphus fraxineus TaxID=746836 RepID=A0A9N9KUK8_9HELO|nr:hypothetical protein HYFRA_00009110 [Hymenoscyphus fraxineus]
MTQQPADLMADACQRPAASQSGVCAPYSVRPLPALPVVRGRVPMRATVLCLCLAHIEIQSAHLPSAVCDQTFKCSQVERELEAEALPSRVVGLRSGGRDLGARDVKLGETTDTDTRNLRTILLRTGTASPHKDLEETGRKRGGEEPGQNLGRTLWSLTGHWRIA